MISLLPFRLRYPENHVKFQKQPSTASLFQSRRPAEWRNMGGSSRAVLVVSNPKTRPPFLRSFPTAASASRHSDGPDPYSLCPCCRTEPAVRETRRRVPPLLALYLYASSRSSSAEERVSRRSHFWGRDCLCGRHGAEKGRGSDNGPVCRRGRPMASAIGFQEGWHPART